MPQKHKNLYTGSAGEHFVAANLLRIGWNANLLSVDTGIDVVGQRIGNLGEPEIIQCQVKTMTRGTYQGSFSKDAIERMWKDAINLIVVFWDENSTPSSIVIPARLVGMLTSRGFKDPNAPLRIRGEKVSMRVYKSGDRCFVRNKHNEVSDLLNRFDLLDTTDLDMDTLPEYAEWSDDEKTLISFDMSYAEHHEQRFDVLT